MKSKGGTGRPAHRTARPRYLVALRLVLPASLLAATTLLLAALCGCHAAPATARVKPLPRPDPAPILAAHTAKDATITTAAQRIDTAVEGSEHAAPIAAETATIRAAIATAPAAQIATLTTRYETALDTRDTARAALATALDKEQLKSTRAYKRWLYTSGGGLLLSFALTLIFGKAAAAARTWPLALLGLSAFVLAEIIGTLPFQIGILCLLAACAAYATYWVIDRHKQGRLAQALEKRARVLREIVPILDQAYETAGEDLRRVLDRHVFDRLSDALAPAEKAQIHEMRKEAQNATA